MKYILSIDQGTTSTRSIVFDENGQQVAISQIEHKQYYPKEAWVEHNPLEIQHNVEKTMHEAVANAKLEFEQITAIGITNQRETVVAWDMKTGQPLTNAIVWQCRRTADRINSLISDGHRELFHKKTGLVLDAYFSGSKMQWMLENIQKVQAAQQDGTLAFGTIDSWITYFLTGQHVTDASNASRTLLFNIQTLDWDDELLEIFHIPRETLPAVLPNAAKPFGYYSVGNRKISINGILGDQQAALFGQLGFDSGAIKSTYGTGNFVLMNTGSEIKYSSNGLLSTVGWQFDGSVNYALEGSVFTSGALFRWLRDELGIIKDYSEIDAYADEVKQVSNLFFVPAFVGLGAPYWDSAARGLIIGLTSSTSKKHIVRAAVDSIAYQNQELIELMHTESQLNIPQLRVDGGVVKSSATMQKQADISQMPVIIPRETETTAFGAALMAGLNTVWDSIGDLQQLNSPKKMYSPEISAERAIYELTKWKQAVAKSLKWV